MKPHQTVIITERDTMVAAPLRVEFTQRDFLALLAADAEEAEHYAQQTRASLVIIDVGRNRLAALDACARIRRLDGYGGCPIVLTTLQATEPVRKAAAAALVTCVLEKPYSFSALADAVCAKVPAEHPVQRGLAPALGAYERQEWLRPPTLSWDQGTDSQLSRNAKLIPLLRGEGVRVPLRGRVS